MSFVSDLGLFSNLFDSIGLMTRHGVARRPGQACLRGSFFDG
jgi:hypothetical protein